MQAPKSVWHRQRRSPASSPSLLLLLPISRAPRAVSAGEEERDIVAHLQEAPAALSAALDHDEDIAEVAHFIAPARDVLYLGRGPDYPMALEGALKLKEISYIHAEGYAAGEMKHGPIALIDDNVPVIVLAPSDPVRKDCEQHARSPRPRRKNRSYQ